MGEWMVQVPTKLRSLTIDRIDADVQRFAPFCEGRSAIVRLLIDVAYAAVDRGMVPWDLAGVQGVLGIPRSQAVPSVPKVVLPGVGPRQGKGTLRGAKWAGTRRMT